MRDSARRGFSLIELLICMTVFSVFVFMVGDMVVTAYRSKGKTEEKVEARRQVSIMYSEIHRQLRTRRLTCYPLDGSSSPPIIPVAGAPLMIEYYRPDGQINQVGYFFDAPTQTVIRSERSPVSAPAHAHVVVRNAKSFTVNWDPAQKISTLSVKVSTITDPITTQIYYYLPALHFIELANQGGNYE